MIFQKTKEQILQSFLKNVGTGKIWPMNNCGLFYFSSGFNTEKYFKLTPYTKHFDYSALNINNGKSLTIYLPMDPIINDSIEGFNRYLDDHSFAQNLEDNFHKNEKLVNEIYEEYTYKRIKNENIETLYLLIQKTFDLIHISNSSLYFSIYFDKELCASVLSSRKYSITKENLDKLWEKATIPVFRSFDGEQEYFGLSLLAQGKTIHEIAEDCQFFYATYRDVQLLPEVEKRLMDKYGNIGAVDAEKKRQEIILHEKQNLEKYNKWYKTLSNEEKTIADYCQTVMRVRDRRKNFFGKVLTVNWRIAERIFKEAGIDSKYIGFVLPTEELVKGVDFIKSIKKEIENRVDGYIIHMLFNGDIEISYKNFFEIKKEIDEHQIKLEQSAVTDVIKGQIACKGKVRGIARIILNAELSESFKEGDILVTGMTRPEFVPLMKKSGAIVTDEGGITCHAAIVSRELNKTCIIGTKIATKVFKDGDLIEVDAERGVVRILKKNNE